PRRLRQLQVPVLALGLCRRLYGTDLGTALPPRRIQDDMVCAGQVQGGKDACKVRVTHLRGVTDTPGDTWAHL
ncbi:PRSS8 protein, partial [Cisticola juncidis]|nr:PRSS8 protein [Cisticola juncidis]